ncbi:MAG TPA: ion transporter [Acidobacteriota bacterium]|nr:ion transporter [Acidobacteriota bacterium]
MSPRARNDGAAEPAPGALVRLVGGRAFQRTIIAVIVANAVLLGVETSPDIMAVAGGTLHVLNVLFQAIFCVEIALRLAAEWPRPLRFFRGGWNVFDFSVVAASLLPVAGPAATIARLARILRVGRLVSSVPELRLIIGTMLRSIPSMGHVILLLAILLYVYAVTGNHIYGAIDPVHWGSLGRSFDSLFQVLTLEGWVEIRAASGPHPASGLFYGSFIFVAVFVVVNLFIAVVINNLESVKLEEERQRAHDAGDDPRAAIARLREELDRLERSLPR